MGSVNEKEFLLVFGLWANPLGFMVSNLKSVKIPVKIIRVTLTKSILVLTLR
jgi:hypothetical protein